MGTRKLTHKHTLRLTSILCAYSLRGRAYFGASCKLDKPMVASAVNLADKLSSGSQWIVYKLKDMQIELKGRMPGFICTPSLPSFTPTLPNAWPNKQMA